MSAFLADRHRVLAPGTVERYARACDLFFRSHSETPSLGSLTRQALSDFFLWLRRPETGLHGQQRSEDTARKSVEVIQILWSWLANDDAFAAFVGPPRTIEMRRSAPPPAVAPTWEEMDRCIASTTVQWQRQLAMVMRFTGLRASQVMAIDWRHVDLDRRTLVVVSGKSAVEKQGRIIPISTHLAAEFAGWGVRDGWLVKSPRRAGVRERQPRARDMGFAWARAGVRREVWEGRPDHAFRKGFISGLKRLGADDEAVSILVGHSIGLRGRYVDPDAVALRDTVDLVPPMASPVPVVRLRKERA